MNRQLFISIASALFIFAASAHAEPIAFRISAFTSTPVTGSPLFVDNLTFPAIAPQDLSATPGFFGPATAYGPIWHLAAAPATPPDSLPHFVRPSGETSVFDSAAFAFSLGLTDLQSGQSSPVHFQGTARTEWYRQSPGLPWHRFEYYVSAGSSDGYFRLGQDYYLVSAATDAHGDGQLLIQASPTRLPEPTTGLLALLGLPLVALGCWKPKRSSGLIPPSPTS